ncbi:hypothetical protein [Brucella rhizosphaerae]|uniref:Mll5186 protein n=1 Tax=Brucella rhizosphaerae TaxID=571254 RepID=A0A256FLH4_9HYPH|nr:hypothetical protein [Brucella rhizosphaerae]OYR15566.1 hypothetical protein CEV32_4842 [Brucella rhizosphaerae]
MVDSTVVENTPDRSYVDWAAIFAGVTVASGVMIVLTTFAGGLGLSSFSVDGGGDISAVWLVLTALFIIISMVASYMLGGYITGRMRRPTGTSTRDESTIRDGLNGLVVWGLGTIVSAMLLVSVVSGGAKAVGSAAETAVQTTATVVGGTAQGVGQLAGGIVSGAGQAVSGLAQGAGQAAAPSVEQMLPQGLKTNPLDYLTDSLLRTDGQGNSEVGQEAQNLAGFQRQISGILGNLLTTGEISDADREWLTNQVATRTGLSQNDAQTRVNQTVERVQALRTDAQKKVEEAQKTIADIQAQAEKTAEEVKSKAADAAEKARITGILTAFLLAASALVAAVAAYIGAVHGGRHREEGRIWGGLAYRK